MNSENLAMGLAGEICGPFSKNVAYEWKIREFYSRISRNCILSSSNMYFMGTNFHFSIDSRIQTASGSQRQICLFLESSLNAWLCPTETVHFTLGVKIANSTKENILCEGTIRKQTSSFRKDFLPSDLLKYYTVQELNTLTVIACAFWIEVAPSVKDVTILSRKTRTEGLPDSVARGKHKMGKYLATKDKTVASRETQTEDLPESGARGDRCTHLDTKGVDDLRKHLKNLLLDGQDHDVTLKVGDNEFEAHKDMLRARSPVFAAMFTHDMRETESGVVTIEDCDPEAFGEFLEFVYTGKVDNLTPSNALGLYYASDKYDFPSLKEMCVEYLKASLSTNMVCDVISMAMKHSENNLLDCSVAFFTDHMMEIWQTVEWQRFMKCNSTLANELNIKAMKRLSQKK